MDYNNHIWIQTQDIWRYNATNSTISFLVTWSSSTNRVEPNPSKSMFFVREFWLLYLEILIINWVKIMELEQRRYAFFGGSQRGYVLLPFWGMPRVQFLISSCVKAYVVTWRPSPTPLREWGKKADMFEGNVLVKKYRGGGQEDNLKRFHIIFGFTRLHLFLSSFFV